MRRTIVAFLVALLATSCFSQTQSPPKPKPTTDGPYWPVLVDPVCPVTNFDPTTAPNATKQMRVMYFPAAEKATIKDPQSLTLQIAFNGPHYVQRNNSIPFSREGDHWEAMVPLQQAMYAMFYVKDSAGAIDDNSGDYWDVLFCNPRGDKEINGVIAQARSYTGESWPLGIHRTKNMDRAVTLLQRAIDYGTPNVSTAFTALWQFKAERDGSDEKAYAKVASDIDAALAAKPDDRMTLYATQNFVLEHCDKLPGDFIDRMVNLIDAKLDPQKQWMRAELGYRRALMESDPKKRLAMLDEVISRYPLHEGAEYREQARLRTLIELKDIPGAEASFARYREGLDKPSEFPNPMAFQEFTTMADLYIDSGIKLNEALKLIDEADVMITKSVQDKQYGLPQSFERIERSQLALLRARAYLALHKPDLAVQQAEMAVEGQKKNAGAYEILADAYAAAGQKQKALDSYFDAALLPSNYDLKYRDELQRYYLKNFGNEKKYEAELKRRIAERFQATNYVPVLLNRPAPALDFITLRGEKFDDAALDGKTVVMNFWSPG